VIVVVFDFNLDLAAAGDGDGRAKGLMRVHNEGKVVGGSNLRGERRAMSLVGIGAGTFVRRLEVPVGAVEANDERLGRSRSEE
jgi:hypothetical protein